MKLDIYINNYYVSDPRKSLLVFMWVGMVFYLDTPHSMFSKVIFRKFNAN